MMFLQYTYLHIHTGVCFDSYCTNYNRIDVFLAELAT